MSAMRLTKINTVADLLRWEPYLPDAYQAELRSIECPAKVGRHKVPKDLNGLTLEELDRFWQSRTPADLFEAAGHSLFGWTRKRTMAAKALPMMGVLNFVTAELERIARLFEAANTPPTAQELMAGCDALDFGTFGLADWYTLRMGLHDHDKAFSTPWVRIYQCRANDAATAAFSRRLAEIQRREMQMKR